MPKLRLCTIEFHESTRIQVSGSVKTKRAGESINIVELGKEDSFGKPHLCGIISEDIVNVTKVKMNIDQIENMRASDRIEWFSSNFPKARIVKIENDKIFDRLKDTREDKKPSVVISSAAEIKWSK